MPPGTLAVSTRRARRALRRRLDYNGSGGVSSGDPIPYGRWELVVRIEGVEADRAP
jgi:hypothetical protein